CFSLHTPDPWPTASPPHTNRVRCDSRETSRACEALPFPPGLATLGKHLGCSAP
ncbi:hypothetical protein Cadr_000031388, partial [Camelus dromedarius]